MWFWTPACVLHWGRYRRHAVAVQSNAQEITFEQLAVQMTAIAEAARSIGLPKTRVAVLTEHKCNFISAVLGLQLAGCSVVICNPLLPPGQLKTTVDDSIPSALVTDFDVARSNAAPAFASVQQRLDTSELIAGTPSDLDSFLANPKWIQPSLTDEWGVLFTSGSTGAPKAILHDNYSMMTESLAWILELELRKSSVFYVGRPIFYTGGLVLTLAMLSIGGTVISDDFANPNSEVELLHWLRRAAHFRQLDWCFMVPEQIRGVLKNHEVWDLPRNPSCILVMGSPITADEKRRAADYFQCRVVESWGDSEGLGTITDADDLEKRPSSIGRAFLSERIFVVDEAGNSCTSGGIGRLSGSDETMFSEYLNRPEATERTKQNSLVISDDIGYRDAGGYFYILGRAQDVVTIEGRTVILSGIEAEIRKIEWVREVCLSALEVGDRIQLYAAVETTPNAAPETSAILTQLNAALIGPDRLAGVITVQAIPRLASGKLDRVSARELIRREFVEGGS